MARAPGHPGEKLGDGGLALGLDPYHIGASYLPQLSPPLPRRRAGLRQKVPGQDGVERPCQTIAGRPPSPDLVKQQSRSSGEPHATKILMGDRISPDDEELQE